MKIVIYLKRLKPEMGVEHNGEELSFCASVFHRKPFEYDFDVFDPINRYWARMPLSVQNQIFQIYKEIYRGFDQIKSTDELYDYLNKQIKQLVTLHPLQSMETWVAMDPSFMIPVEVKDAFIADPEKKNKPEKTYLTKDYIQLTALSIFTRCMLPIFGEYIESTRRKIGIDFKESYAVYLLKDTGILECRAVAKLTDYISQLTKEHKTSAERILNGNSSEDMNFFLVALVLVRKLGVSDVSGRANLVSRVYNFVYQKVFNPTKTAIPVREKKFGSEGSSSDGAKRSILESYRQRTEFSLGDRAGFEYGHEDLYGTALRLAPNITKEEIDRCLVTAEALKNERIGDAQLLIMAWVEKNIHSPQTVYYLSQKLTWQAMAVLEAVLWHWGFHYLSILSTSHMLLSQETMYISPIDSIGQIPQDLQDQILEEYPFVWTNTRKSGGVNQEEPHPVLHAINLVVDDLTNSAWRSTASEEKVVQVFGEMRRKLVIFPTIKSELAKLVIFMSTHEPISFAPAQLEHDI